MSEIAPSDRAALASLRPAEFTVYKAYNGQGFAAKFNLRLTPEYGDGGWVSKVSGGLFLELVPEGAKNAGGDATFQWTSDRVVRAKLGLQDVTALIGGIEGFRHGGAVPVYFRKGKKMTDKALAPADTIVLFHKSDTAGTTAISYTLTPDGGKLHMSKDAERKAQISFNPADEVAILAYLRLALDAFLKLGAR